MCRMMAVVAPGGLDADLLARFRTQASDGRHLRIDAPGHRDGWGVVAYRSPGAPFYLGRSAGDASTDPRYEEALAKVRATPLRGVALAHVRAASLGAVSVENAHPFVDGPFAFCHNGTVHGVAPPGENDSRALFARILRDVRGGASPEEAIHKLAAHVDGQLTYSSLTLLLTDGRTLWGLRKVGNDPVECAAEQCAPDYYTLGVARVGVATIVSQEHEFLGLGASEWTPLRDGELVIVDEHGRARHERVLQT